MKLPFSAFTYGWRLFSPAILACSFWLGACAGDDDKTMDLSDAQDEDGTGDEGDSDDSEQDGDSEENADTADSDDEEDSDDEAQGGRIDAGATGRDSGAPARDSGASTARDSGASPRSDGGASTAPDGGTDREDSGSAPPPAREDQGEGDGTDVIMVGDSWMSLGGASSGIQGGVLKASEQPYRAYSIPGTTLLGGGLLEFLSPIPTQYQDAVQADPDIKTVIMTGGGNDILQTGLQEDCQMDGEACAEQVTKILDGLSDLWAEMAEDGVQDVVYILYATPEGTSVDFLLPEGDSAPARCADVPAPLRCHIVETLDIVMGDIPDGIHPSQAASDRIGEAVYALMAERGMRR